MNHQHEPHAGFTRSGAALAAILVTTLLGLGIDGLAMHYSVEALQAAQKPADLAQR